MAFDFLKNLRMRSIFGPQTPIGNDMPEQGGITGQMPMGGGLQFPGRDPYQGLFDTGPVTIPPPTVDTGMPDYTPAHEMTDRFNKMVGERPNEADYHPGIWRRLGSALTAFGPGGMNLGMQMLDKPYTDKLQAWKENIAPAYQAAQLERYGNVNELTARRDEGRYQQAEEKNRIAEMRARVYQFKSQNPGAKIVVQRGGNTVAIDPISGKTIRDFGPSGLMDEQTKSDLEFINKTELQGQAIQGRKDVANIGNEASNTRVDEQGWMVVNIPDPNNPGQTIPARYNPRSGKPAEPIQYSGSTTQTPTQVTGPTYRLGTQPTNRPEPQSQQRIGVVNKANEFKNTYPELGKWITVQGNDVTVTPPRKSDSFFANGPTPAEHQQIMDAIYGQGNSGPQNTGGRGGGPGRFTPQNPPKAPPGWKYVPDGRGGWTATQSR